MSAGATDRAPGLGLGLEHEHPPLGVGEDVGSDEPVGPGAHHDCIDVHRATVPAGDRGRYRAGPGTGQDRRVHEADATSAVVVEGAVLAEGGVRVLGPLDLVVGTDERWVVLGPNGCGKTSLLRLLSFQRAPDEGRVTILGNTYGRVDIRDSRHRIGFASSALLQILRPALTAREVVVTGVDAVLEPWWNTYSPEQNARAEALLGFVGCAEHVDQPVGTLSEGERKRLLVARLLMADPNCSSSTSPVPASTSVAARRWWRCSASPPVTAISRS